MSDDVASRSVILRLFPDAAKARDIDTKKPAPERVRKGRKGKTVRTTTAGHDGTGAAASLQRPAAEAYLRAGGSLEPDEWRNVLARQTANAQRKGIPERVIIAAAAALGREREFPGYLLQRAEAFAVQGGPCSWEGLQRDRLTDEQLAECECHLCAEWRAHRLAGATA